MAVKDQTFVPAQNADIYSLDYEYITGLSAYTSGNSIFVSMSNGSTVEMVFDRNVASSSSANFIELKQYSPDWTLLEKASGFSIFFDGSASSTSALLSRVAALDSYYIYSSADDIIHFDVANDAIQDYRDMAQYSSVIGRILYVDAGGGVDTLYEDYWSSSAFDLVKDSSGRYWMSFVPTNQYTELRNFEYVDFSDTSLMTLDQYIAFKNPVVNYQATFSNAWLSPSPHISGNTLSVNIDISDGNGLGSGLLDASWFRFDGANYIDTGVDGSTYTLTDGDVGYQMAVQFSFIDGAGFTEFSDFVSIWDDVQPAGELYSAIPMNLTYFVQPQYWDREYLDAFGLGEEVGSYTDGNAYVQIYSSGFTEVLLYDRNLEGAPYAYRIEKQLRDSEGTTLASYTGFSHYIDPSDSSTRDAARLYFDAADVNLTLTAADDFYDYDPAENNAQQYDPESGQLVSIDAGDGIDTLRISTWGADSLVLNKISDSSYTIFDPMKGLEIQLSNFEYLQFGDSEAKSFESYLSSDDSLLREHQLTLLVSIFGQDLYLENLTEVITEDSHIINYAGVDYDYAEVDGFVMTVIRDGEFTQEFSQEIADEFPEASGISYSTAVGLIGVEQIGNAIISVAKADGSLVL